MAAPLPTGSSLQALPVAPNIDPRLGVANVDPMAGMQQGIDFAGSYARLGQLRSKLELEDAQRKADAAKAKAAQLEAEIMQGELEKQHAIALAQAKQNLINSQIAGTGGLVQNSNAMTAGTGMGINNQLGQVNLDQAKKDATFKNYVRDNALNQLGLPSIGGSPAATPALSNVSPTLDTTPAPTSAPVSSAAASPALAPTATSVATPGAPAPAGSVTIPFQPNADLTTWLRAPMAAEVLSTGTPVSPATLAKKLGVERKTRTFIDPNTKSEYEVDLQEGPSGEIFKVLSTPRFVKVSPLQADVDKQTADDISEFNNGGKEKAQAQLKKLDEVIKVLRKPGTIGASGPIVGLLPDAIRKPFTTDESLAVEPDVKQVVMTGLKATLGQRFTQTEANQILDTAYNRFLSEPANADRLQTLRDNMQALLDAKSSQVEYFRQHGTLAGFAPGAAAAAVVPAKPAAPAAGGEIRVDPTTGKKWKNVNGVVTEVVGG